jgi:hypothetical protein
MSRIERRRAQSVGVWIAVVTAVLACVAAALSVLAAMLQLVASWTH